MSRPWDTNYFLPQGRGEIMGGIFAMTIRLKIAVFILFSLFVLSMSLSFAQPFPQPPGMRPDPGMGMRPWRGEDQCWRASELNLSSDQAKGLELIQQSYLRETQLLRAEIFLKRLELRDLLTSSTVSIESIRSKHSEINELQSRLEEKVFDHLIKVRNLLTKEQLKNWCPESEIPRRMMRGPGSRGPMPPKRTPFQERLRED
jgi:Spy/CpxP family protein refolding chaperone